MNSSKKIIFYKIFLYFLIFFYSFKINALIVGSTDSLSIEDTISFPSVDSNNTVTGFAWLKNGFSLEDETTSCTFDALFPISGEVNLNGGSLYLQSDLKLDSASFIQAMGSIYGNDYVLNLLPSVDPIVFNFDNDTFEDLGLFFSSDLTISGRVTFDGDCLINGDKNKLTLVDTAKLKVASGASLKFKDLSVLVNDGSEFYCEDDTGQIILENVKLIFDQNYNFSIGSFLIKDSVSLLGTQTFQYSSSKTFTIDTNSTLQLAKNLRFETGKQDPDGEEPLCMMDGSSVLHIKKASFCITSSGMQVDRGTFFIDQDVIIEVDSTSTTYGLHLGGDDLVTPPQIYLTPGAALSFLQGHVIFDISTPNAFISKSKTSEIIRSAASSFYIKQDLILKNVTLNVDPSAELIVDDGVAFDYDDCDVKTSQLEMGIGGKRYNFYTNLLNGDDSLFISKGNLAAYTLVRNSGNVIHGTGNISGLITLEDSDAVLTLNMNGFVDNNISLNGGTLTLGEDVAFSSDKQILGSGNVVLGGKSLSFGPKDSTWATPIYWDGESLSKIDINSNVSLSSTWTFSGDIVVSGYRDILSLSDGKIVVDSNSNIKFKNLTFDGLEDGWLDVAVNSTFEFNKITFDEDPFSSGVTSDSILLFQNNCRFNNGFKLPANSTLKFQVPFSGILNLNDKILTLQSDFALAPDGFFHSTASGTIAVDSDSNNRKLLFSGNQTTQGKFSINNNLVIDGNNYDLNLSSSITSVTYSTSIDSILLSTDDVVNPLATKRIGPKNDRSAFDKTIIKDVIDNTETTTRRISTSSTYTTSKDESVFGISIITDSTTNVVTTSVTQITSSTISTSIFQDTTIYSTTRNIEYGGFFIAPGKTLTLKNMKIAAHECSWLLFGDRNSRFVLKNINVTGPKKVFMPLSKQVSGTFFLNGFFVKA